MRARYSRSLGMPVVEEESADILGALGGILLQPDTGIVEGFFVRVPGMLRSEELFLGSSDILHWGTRITVRHRDVLSPLEDRVRLQSLLGEKRTVIGQKIVTESGRNLGRCNDIQFSTEHFRLEWLFPRIFWRWGIPIPAKQILEVRPEAIIIRDAAVPEGEQESIAIIPQIPEAA